VSRFGLPLVVCLALVAGCGGDDDETAQDRSEPAPVRLDTLPAETAPGAEAAARGPLVKLRDSQFGPVLFSGADRALYLFTRDRKRKVAATATAP
jgi:hypothetical protein